MTSHEHKHEHEHEHEHEPEPFFKALSKLNGGTITNMFIDNLDKQNAKIGIVLNDSIVMVICGQNISMGTVHFAEFVKSLNPH